MAQRTIEDRMDDFNPQNIDVPQDWDSWWANIVPLAKAGVDIYAITPPPQVVASGSRPAYTLRPDPNAP